MLINMNSNYGVTLINTDLLERIRKIYLILGIQNLRGSGNA